MNCCRWALTALLLVPPAYAQSGDSPDRGVLTGRALDSHHLPVPGAKIYLQRDGQKEELTGKTDSAGVYRFTGLSGKYTVRADSEREGEAKAGPFSVTPDRVTTVDLVLVTQPQFFDEPQFTVAGVTDNTYRGGHGSDTVLRSAEALAKDTASLGTASADTSPLEAVQEFQRAAELNPSEHNLFDWGTELLSHRAPQAAGEVFTKGVRLFPQSVRMLLGLASALYAGGSYEKAAHWFFQAADLDPNDPNPYMFLSKVQSREITQSAGYEERMARFARLRPDNASANYYYAVSIWTSRQSPEARALLEKALAINPHLATAYLQLGIVFASEQRYPNAIAAYQKAISESPELEEAHYRLSEAYRVTGERSKAEQEQSTYHQLSKQSAEKLERERRETQQFVIDLRETKKTQ